MANDGNLWQHMHDQLVAGELLEQVKVYATEYLQQVNDQRVFPDEAALGGLAHFDEPLPQAVGDSEAILQNLHEYGAPATTAQIGGRYFGFVNGGILPVGLAARWLADAWDQTAGLYLTSPIAAKLEHISEKWMVDLLGLPAGTAMGVVTGTSNATMCGLAAGRNTLLKNQGWDVNEQGLAGSPAIRVVMGAHAHGSVKKALALIGIGQKQIEIVPIDNQGRMDPTQLPELDNRTLLILQAGNVNSGAFDDFVTLCQRAKDAGAWVHIDGAFGLWAAASPNTRHLTAGIERADSWSVDGHKTLNTPYDCGLILCRDRAALTAAMQATGDYIQYSEDRDNMLYTMDMSRQARGITLWATLKYLGREGVAALIDRLCDHAALFSEQLQAAGFRVLNDVVFNQVLVACDSPNLTETTLRHIQQSGECWCGGSKWFGEPVIRISVCNWMTTPQDVERSVRAFAKARENAILEITTQTE
ncbi:MAG: aspartate aminotransferase family protein [Anaerolineaceae bacterium]|nr:aspartate aminotransferase family protein [Anaerolineae bacterium]MCB9460962.1 aspartate aminotransferase family protein [Anaerolineaceae bacterium]